MGSYLPHTEEERGEMLEAIGVHTIEELYRSVPQEMLLSAGLDLPEGMSVPMRRKTGYSKPSSGERALTAI